MKKVVCFLLAFLAIIPGIFLAGCKDKDTAENVRNRTYYVTMFKIDSVDKTSTKTNQKMRIIFTDDNFKMVIGEESNAATYGYYLGTYTIEDNTITLKTTKSGGTLENIKKSATLKDYLIETLYYNEGTLHSEFVNNGNIIQYQFKLPN